MGGEGGQGVEPRLGVAHHAGGQVDRSLAVAVGEEGALQPPAAVGQRHGVLRQHCLRTGGHGGRQVRVGHGVEAHGRRKDDIQRHHAGPLGGDAVQQGGYFLAVMQVLYVHQHHILLGLGVVAAVPVEVDVGKVELVQCRLQGIEGIGVHHHRLAKPHHQQHQHCGEHSLHPFPGVPNMMHLP